MVEKKATIVRCGPDRVDSAIYVARQSGQDNIHTARAYYYLNDEGLPFLTYDAGLQEYSYDLSRTGKVDKKHSRKVVEQSVERLCDIVKQLKR